MTLRHALLICSAGLLFVGCARFDDRPISSAQTAAAFEARSLSGEPLRDFIATNLHRPSMPWPLTNWDFESATLAAFYFHPSLDLARSQWASAQGDIKTAGGRPNPILSVTPGYSANPPRGISPWFPSVTLDVPIETAGKRGYRLAHAEHLSEAARLKIITAAWQVRSNLRLALLDYDAARRRADLFASQVQLERRLLTVLEQRLAAGAAAAPDVTPARLRLLKAQTDDIDAQRVALETRGRLAEAIGVPLQALAGLEFSSGPDPVSPDSIPAPDLRRAALQGRADVLAALAEYDAAQSALQLEIARQYPDLHFNPGYQYDQGENKWSLGLSVELPVLNRNEGPIAAARARREEAAARFLSVQAGVISQLDRAELLRAGARHQLAQAEELIALSAQQLQQLEQSLRAGAADQLEVATARVETAAAGLARLDAMVKLQQATALLEDALQRPFDALTTLERNPRTALASPAPAPSAQKDPP